MRRKDREVTQISQIKQILDGCKTCHLAMVDDGQPYVIPLNYAYVLDDEALTLYFHSAKEGRKIRILQENSAVCFEISDEGEPIFAKEKPCESGFYYSCVHGFGNTMFVNDISEKCYALNLLMKQQVNMDTEFAPAQADSVCIIKVTSTEYTGKIKPHPTD